MVLDTVCRNECSDGATVHRVVWTRQTVCWCTPIASDRDHSSSPTGQVTSARAPVPAFGGRCRSRRPHRTTLVSVEIRGADCGCLVERGVVVERCENPDCCCRDLPDKRQPGELPEKGQGWARSQIRRVGPRGDLSPDPALSGTRPQASQPWPVPIPTLLRTHESPSTT